MLAALKKCKTVHHKLLPYGTFFIKWSSDSMQQILNPRYALVICVNAFISDKHEEIYLKDDTE